MKTKLRGNLECGSAQPSLFLILCKKIPWDVEGICIYKDVFVFISCVDNSLKMGSKTEREKTARRKVLKGLVDLRNQHKVVSLLVWVTSMGTSFFGNEGLKEKAKKAFSCSCVCSCSEGNEKFWMDTLEEDERDLLDCEGDFDPGMDLLEFMDMETPIQKLPMKLELMVYNDLAKWLRPQIIRNRHERGFDGVKIVYKDASWCPSFWPTEMCEWIEVSNFSKLRRGRSNYGIEKGGGKQTD